MSFICFFANDVAWCGSADLNRIEVRCLPGESGRSGDQPLPSRVESHKWLNNLFSRGYSCQVSGPPRWSSG